VDVPADLYTVTTKTYGSVTAVQIVVNKALSTITDQGWSVDLYVTFESSVGPDIVEIVKYLIAGLLGPGLGYHGPSIMFRKNSKRSGQLPRSWSGRTSLRSAGDRLPGPLRTCGSTMAWSS